MLTDQSTKKPLLSKATDRVPRNSWLMVVTLSLSALSLACMAGILLSPLVEEQGLGRDMPVNASYSFHMPIHLEAAPATESLAAEIVQAGDTHPEKCSDSRTKGAATRFTKSELDDSPLRNLHVRTLQDAVASNSEPKVLATWSRDSIYLSVDDGGSFGSILSPPGELIDVTLSCGHVYALAKPNWIGHRDVDGNENWRPLSFLVETEDGFPADTAIQIAADKSQLVVTQVDRGDTLIALSRDHGVSWGFERPRVAGAEYVHDLRIKDGKVSVALGLGDCDWDGLQLLSTTGRGNLSSSREVSVYGYFGLGPDGHAYFNNHQCQDAVCGITTKKNAKLQPVRNLPVATQYSRLVQNHKASFIVADNIVYRIVKGRASQLSAVPLPSELSVRASDRRGRLLAIDQEGALLQWSRVTGIKALLEPSTRQ